MCSCCMLGWPQGIRSCIYIQLFSGRFMPGHDLFTSISTVHVEIHGYRIQLESSPGIDRLLGCMAVVCGGM